jgi:TPP-dependent pyruvate/acetoin dehydrogenase alpha subunit
MPHSTSDDPSRYRDEEQYKAWLKRDPVELFRRFLVARRVVTEAWEKKLQAELDAEVDVAIKEAEAAQLPAPETMFYDVYATVPDLLKDQAKQLRGSLERGEYAWPPKGH